jgi:F-type H+-transporting ATPase subunit b
VDSHFWFSVINFLLFVGILTYFLRTPFKEFWGSRSELLKKEIEESARRRKQAKEQLETMQSRLAGMSEEIKALKGRMKKDGELEKERITQEAKAYAERLQEIGKKIAEQESVKAERALKELGARLAVDLAEQLMQEKVTAEDQERLLGISIKQLQSRTWSSEGAKI